MPVIGEELRALLGMIPVRDRAGIARGNLAQETLANEANAEGQALLQQANQRPMMPQPAPPPLQIPSGMGRPGPADPETTGSIAPPTPTSTTTVTAPPAGAAAQFDDQMARRAKMAGFNDIVSSLGLIINGAANRGSSQGSTRDTLLAGMGSGGMSVPEVVAVDKHRQELIAADEARVNRANRIRAYQRETGADLERATAAVDTGNDTKALDPATIKTRAGDKATEGTRASILADPKLIKELSDNYGISPEMVTAHLKSGGAFDATTMATLAQSRGATAKAAADTTKAGVETREKIADLAGIEEAQSKPAAVAERYRQMGYTWVTEDTVKSAAANKTTWTKFNENHQPLSTETQKDLAVENRMRLTRAQPEYTPSEFRKAGQQPHIEEPSVKAGSAGVTAAVKQHIEKDQPETEKIADNIAISNAEAQARWDPNLITGGGKISKMTEAGLRSAGNILGIPNDRVANTQLFFNHMRAEALKIRQADMPGSMSNDDRDFLEELGTGNREWSPATAQKFLIAQEKYELAQLHRKNEKTRERKAEDPVAYAGARIVPVPPPNRFLRQALESPDGQKMLRHLMGPDADEGDKLKFDETFGKGRADYFLRGGK